jgi:hypothetical protein
MKLYSRQINSVAELQKEKARLAGQCREMERQATEQVTNFQLPGFSSSKKSKAGSDSTSGYAALLNEVLPGAGSILKIVEDVLPEGNGFADTLRRKSAKLAGDAAKEVIGGYLKWKAVELGFRGVRYLLGRRKQCKTRKQQTKAN